MAVQNFISIYLYVHVHIYVICVYFIFIGQLTQIKCKNMGIKFQKAKLGVWSLNRHSLAITFHKLLLLPKEYLKRLSVF